MAKEKPINLFTFLDQIQTKRRTVPYDKKIAGSYMLSHWLAHDKELIGRVNKINKFQFLLPDEVIYNYYMSTVPTGKRFLKWTKKRESDNKLKKRIEKLQEIHPEMSIRECKMVISYLTNCKGER